MAGQHDGGTGTIVLGATVEQFRRVKKDGTKAAAAEADVGTTLQRGDSGEAVGLSFTNKQGTTLMVGNAAIADGADVFAAADGKVAPAGTINVGIAWAACAGDDAVFEVMRNGS